MTFVIWALTSAALFSLVRLDVDVRPPLTGINTGSGTGSGTSGGTGSGSGSGTSTGTGTNTGTGINPGTGTNTGSNTDTKPAAPPTYVSAGTLPLTAATTVQCQCRGAFTANQPVCGTNGVTYNNTCLLKSAQIRLTTLGWLCNGQCPCNNVNMPKIAAAAGSCTDSPPAALKAWKRPIKCDPVQRYCMTDNTEETRGTVYCRMSKNPTIGIKCAGRCSECLSYNCPPRLARQLPVKQDCPNPPTN